MHVRVNDLFKPHPLSDFNPPFCGMGCTKFSLVPRPSPHVGERGSGVLLVKWGGVAFRSESSNQIAERLIICDDAGNRA